MKVGGSTSSEDSVCFTEQFQRPLSLEKLEQRYGKVGAGNCHPHLIIRFVSHQRQCRFQTTARLIPLLRLLIEQCQIVPESGDTVVIRRQQLFIEMLHRIIGGKCRIILSGGTVGVGTVQQRCRIGNCFCLAGIFKERPCARSRFQHLRKTAAVPIESHLLIAQRLFCVRIAGCLRLCDSVSEKLFCLG